MSYFTLDLIYFKLAFST